MISNRMGSDNRIHILSRLLLMNRKIEVDPCSQGQCEICCIEPADLTVKVYTKDKSQHYSYKLCSNCYGKVV